MGELSIQSWCLRKTKTNAEVAAKVKELGLAGIELCGVHCKFDDESTHDEAIKTYADAGIQIVSIGVEAFTDDETKERKLCEFAKKAGARQISADFAIGKVPEAYRTAERLADEYDLKLAIHNHGGQHWLGANPVLANVFANTSERIGLCCDTAWAMHSHADPVKMCERFKDRLYGVHIKDFTFDAAGKHSDVVVGTGNLDLPALIATVKSATWDCPLIIEYEADVDDPMPALAECVAACRKVL